MIYTLFIVYTIVLKTTLQNVFDTSFSNIMARVAFEIDLFLLSTIPFFLGILSFDSYLLMSFTSQKVLKSLKVNPPPLYDLKHLIYTPDSFSTIFLNNLNFSNALDFSLRNATHIIIVNLSTKIMKYLST